MKFGLNQKKWHLLGIEDPLWAILSREDKRGRKWNIDEFFASGVGEITEIMRYIDSLNIKINFRRALDFGCGVGRLTQALANYFDEVLGVDIAPSMIEQANEYNTHGQKCKYIRNDLGDLKIFQDNHFDFVYSIITLQHIKPRYAKRYMREFLRVLTPNGLLIFQLPAQHLDLSFKARVRHWMKSSVPIGLLEFYRNMRYGYSPFMEMYGIKKDTIIRFIKQNGGEVLDIRRNRMASNEWLSFEYAVKKNRFSKFA